MPDIKLMTWDSQAARHVQVGPILKNVAQIPRIGENIHSPQNAKFLYKVTAVVHTPNAASNIDADVFVTVDPNGIAPG